MKREDVTREDMMATIENRDQAMALCEFLWNEKQRNTLIIFSRSTGISRH